MIELGLIFRALLRNKVGALLIALQIALTMTIMVNAVFMMQERSAQMQRPSGLDEANQFYLSNTIFAQDYDHQAALERDLELIRSTPGVVDAIQINAIPLSGGGWSMGLQTEPGEDKDGTGVAVYMVDERGINTLGVELIAGDNFNVNDIQWREASQSGWPAKTIISQKMAEALFPDDWQSALGQTVYIASNQPIQVIGIIKALQAPWNGWSGVERSMLVPFKMETSGGRYFIRTEAGQRDLVMPVIEKKLAEADKGRIIRRMRTMDETRERSYRMHNATNKILMTVVITLTLITGFGIIGLAMFSINRRRKQIGTRRALGATKGQIMSYFMIENMMISTLGIVLGTAGAIGLNIWLVSTFTLAPVKAPLVIAAIITLFIVGQLAVYYPARKAASISPAMATRSV
jgi:putative ABC transport system permease protein